MKRLAKRLGPAWNSWAEQFACGNPSCAGPRRWLRELSRRRPASVRLHGTRSCFPGCFEYALERRFSQLLHGPSAKPLRPHRIPLGLLMLARGDIDSVQLQAALAAQRTRAQGRIGEWIESLGFARPEQITSAVGAQWSCPVLPKLPAEPLMTSLPLPLLHYFRMAPVHYVEAMRLMHVAFAESLEYSALLAIEQALECRAQPCIVSSVALDSLLSCLDEAPRRPDQVFPAVAADEMARTCASYAGVLRAEDVRLVRCAGFIWARLQAGTNAVNLLFQMNQPNTLALATRERRAVTV